MNREFGAFAERPMMAEPLEDWLGVGTSSPAAVPYVGAPAFPSQHEAATQWMDAPAEDSYEETRATLSPEVSDQAMLGAFGHMTDGMAEPAVAAGGGLVGAESGAEPAGVIGDGGQAAGTPPSGGADETVVDVSAEANADAGDEGAEEPVDLALGDGSGGADDAADPADAPAEESASEGRATIDDGGSDDVAPDIDGTDGVAEIGDAPAEDSIDEGRATVGDSDDGAIGEVGTDDVADVSEAPAADSFAETRATIGDSGVEDDASGEADTDEESDSHDTDGATVAAVGGDSDDVADVADAGASSSASEGRATIGEATEALSDRRAKRAARSNVRSARRLGFSASDFGSEQAVGTPAFARDVAAFQTANGLRIDGIAGPITIGALRGGGGASPSATATTQVGDSTMAPDLPPVQAKSCGALTADCEVQATAARGVSGSGSALPYLGEIETAFGLHDISGIRAHVGGAAADAAGAIGASAYATGTDVAFAQAPDLFTAAHEAAHVVQQRAGVQLLGGVGQAGDTYEQNADAVAAAVVRGESAAHLLGSAAAAAGPVGFAVQRKENSASSAGASNAGRRARVRRKFLRLVRRRMPAPGEGGQNRALAIARRRAQLNAWIAGLPPEDARYIALQTRPGGDLFADFKGQLATSERREIRAQLGGMVALPGADGKDRTGVGTSTVGVNDSTLFDPRAKGREDEFVASGNLAVQVGPTHFRLWGFDVNSTVVRAEYADCLRRVAKLVKGDEKAKIGIEGHTSGSGQEANNMSLGDSRAVSVAAALVDRGVGRPRITAEGKGSSVALARAGKNPAAMARNRRVEIRLQLSKPKPKTSSKKPPAPPTRGFPRIKRVIAAQPKSYWQQSALCMLDKYEVTVHAS